MRRAVGIAGAVLVATVACDYSLHHVKLSLQADATWRRADRVPALLSDGAQGGAGLAPTAVLPALPADERPIVAVMDIEDQSGDLKQATVETLTDYLRALLAGSGRFMVVDKGRQQETRVKLVKDLREESYKPCYDRSCQIPLGQALAADSVLATNVMRLGNTYIVRSELVDLAKGASVAGGTAKCDALPRKGLEDRLATALESLLPQVAK